MCVCVCARVYSEGFCSCLYACVCVEKVCAAVYAAVQPCVYVRACDERQACTLCAVQILRRLAVCISGMSALTRGAQPLTT